MTLTADYEERVYAGVLGKIIGVYLGRPFEGWSYEAVSDQLGEIWYYVNDRIAHKPPLIVTDDDISGTFTFLRAFQDYDYSPDLTPQQIGQTWLNYLIEGKTILWWGGLGNSTEHTAYMRLKNGIPAPRSGSVALNGPIVSEQIGAQIFIDGWGLINPGDPERAADFARRAASVSHDGEAIYGAQVIAAMEAQAFVESDIDKLLDVGLSVIPKESTIYKLIGDLREWHDADQDWRKTRERIVGQYGYETYGGGCHMIPNHALISLSLLYSEGDFQKALMVGNTCGWDTDCNSANIGCLMGVRNGLEGIVGADWRGPIADRLYLPTADGGRCITDAVRETFEIVNAGRSLAGLPAVAPKGGARFHFELPGSVQGFIGHAEDGLLPLEIANVRGHSKRGQRSLSITLANHGRGRAMTATFIPPSEQTDPSHGYQLIASPTLYPGQTVTTRLEADPQNVRDIPIQLLAHAYGLDNTVKVILGPEAILAPGTSTELSWTVSGSGSEPICEIGIELSAPGTVYLDYLSWTGEPSVTFDVPEKLNQSKFWRMQWVQATDQWITWGKEGFRIVQNDGRGMLMNGCREWRDYRVSATIRPTLMESGGLAARVQGLQRFYSLELVWGGGIRLVKALDGDTVLAEAHFDWQLWQAYPMTLAVNGNRIQGWINDQLVFDLEDMDRPLSGGGIGLVVTEGHLMTAQIKVEPSPN